jgi:hypothetical protein
MDTSFLNFDLDDLTPPPNSGYYATDRQQAKQWDAWRAKYPVIEYLVASVPILPRPWEKDVELTLAQAIAMGIIGAFVCMAENKPIPEMASLLRSITLMKNKTLQINHNGESVTLTSVVPEPLPIHVPGARIPIPAIHTFEAVSPTRGAIGRIGFYQNDENAWTPVSFTTSECQEIAQAAADALNPKPGVFLYHDPDMQNMEEFPKDEAFSVSAIIAPGAAVNTRDEYERAIASEDPIEIFYGPSKKVAHEKALLWCKEQGYRVVEPPSAAA